MSSSKTAINGNGCTVEYQDIDINDAFDKLVCLEEAALEDGRQEGLLEGKVEGLEEGLEVGFNTGYKAGQEIFYAKGFCETLLAKETSDSGGTRSGAVTKLSKDILSRVSSFPTANTESVDIVSILKEVKSLMDRLKSLLGEQTSGDISQKYSF